VHRAPWPTSDPGPGDPRVLTTVSEILGRLRKAKSDAKLSMRAEISKLTVTSPVAELVAQAQNDLCGAGMVEEFVLVQGAETVVEVQIG